MTILLHPHPTELMTASSKYEKEVVPRGLLEPPAHIAGGLTVSAAPLESVCHRKDRAGSFGAIGRMRCHTGGHVTGRRCGSAAMA